MVVLSGYGVELKFGPPFAISRTPPSNRASAEKKWSKSMMEVAR